MPGVKNVDPSQRKACHRRRRPAAGGRHLRPGRGRKVCEDYAHAAIVQVRAGMSIPRCEGGMRGTRWSPEWRVHYDWCRGASYQQIGAERDARTEHLRACR